MKTKQELKAQLFDISDMYISMLKNAVMQKFTNTNKDKEEVLTDLIIFYVNKLKSLYEDEKNENK